MEDSLKHQMKASLGPYTNHSIQGAGITLILLLSGFSFCFIVWEIYNICLSSANAYAFYEFILTHFTLSTVFTLFVLSDDSVIQPTFKPDGELEENNSHSLQIDPEKAAAVTTETTNTFITEVTQSNHQQQNCSNQSTSVKGD